MRRPKRPIRGFIKRFKTKKVTTRDRNVFNQPTIKNPVIIFIRRHHLRRNSRFPACVPVSRRGGKKRKCRKGHEWIWFGLLRYEKEKKEGKRIYLLFSSVTFCYAPLAPQGTSQEKGKASKYRKQHNTIVATPHSGWPVALLVLSVRGLTQVDSSKRIF